MIESAAEENSILDEARRHLLLSFPDLDIEHDSTAVVDAAIEGGIFEVLSARGLERIVIIHDLVQAMKSRLGLAYESAEVQASIERLGKAGKLTFLDKGHKGFVFSEPRFRALEGMYRARLQGLELAKVEWWNELRTRHKLTDQQLELLWSGLERFMAAVVNTHAAEAAAFLHISTDIDQVRFYSVLSAKLPIVDDFVPSDLSGVACSEYPAFFDPTSRARRDCIADRLRGAFFFHLLAIDPSASALVQASVSEKTLYLDTNVLYRILGFHGPALMAAPAATIEIARTLKCRLLVSTETIQEFLHSLRADTARLKSMPIARESYKRIAAEHPGDEWAFMSAYYREWLSGRVKNEEEFERKYSNIEAFLTPWGIAIDENAVLTKEQKESPEFVDQLSELNQWHNQHKGLPVLEHDLFMLHLVRSLRGDSDTTVSTIKYWFLTYDRRLTAYAVYHASSARLPGCMLGDNWLQLTRPFLPRTENYQEAFVAMLRHPLAYQESHIVPFEHIVQALSRLDRYEELPTSVVAAMVSDGEFVRRLEEAKDETMEREVLELKLGQMSAHAVEETRQVAQDLMVANERVQALETTVALEKEDKAEAQLATVRLQSELEGERQRSEDLIATVTGEHEARIRELQTAFNALKGEVQKRNRWGIYALMQMLVTLSLWAIVWTRWESLRTMDLTVFAGWWLIIGILLLGIPLRDRFGTVAMWLGVIGTVLSLGGLTYQLVTTGPIGESSTPDSLRSTVQHPVRTPPVEVPNEERQ